MGVRVSPSAPSLFLSLLQSRPNFTGAVVSHRREWLPLFVTASHFFGLTFWDRDARELPARSDFSDRRDGPRARADAGSRHRPLAGASPSDAQKLSPYECGFEAFEDSRMKFDVRYYLVAILFIVFDLEIAFLFPWAVVLKHRHVRPGRHGHLPVHPRGRIHLRMEEGSARVGLEEQTAERHRAGEFAERGFLTTYGRHPFQLGAHRFAVADDFRAAPAARSR